MAKSKTTAKGRATGDLLVAEAHDALMRRLLVAVNQLRLVSDTFGDLASLPHRFVPAGLTMQETTKDLDQLYNEFDQWFVGNRHEPRADLGVRS